MIFASSGNAWTAFGCCAHDDDSFELSRSTIDSLVSVKKRSKTIPNIESDMEMAFSKMSERASELATESENKN